PSGCLINWLGLAGLTVRHVAANLGQRRRHQATVRTHAVHLPDLKHVLIETADLRRRSRALRDCSTTSRATSRAMLKRLCTATPLLLVQARWRGPCLR